MIDNSNISFLLISRVAFRNRWHSDCTLKHSFKLILLSLLNWYLTASPQLWEGFSWDMRLTEGEYEEFRARCSLRLIRKGVLAFYLWEFTDAHGTENEPTNQGSSFIAALVMIASIGLGLLIFHFSNSQDWLTQWLQSLSMWLARKPAGSAITSARVCWLFFLKLKFLYE